MSLSINPIIFIIPTLALLMFGLGAELRWCDFSSFFKQPKSLIVGLIAQLVGLPLIALFLIVLFEIPEPYAIGILLLALSPGGSSSNAFTMMAGGNVALSVSLTAISGVITIFTIPLVLMWYMHSANTIELPILNIFIQNVILMLLPLLLGMLTLKYKPTWANHCANFIKSKGIFLLFFIATIFFIDNRTLIIANFSNVALILVLLLVGCTLLGAAIGRLMQLKQPDRTAIVIEVGMQNAAQTIALACSPLVFNNNEMAIPAIIYSLLMNIFFLSYLFIKRAYAKKQAIS